MKKLFIITLVMLGVYSAQASANKPKNLSLRNPVTSGIGPHFLNTIDKQQAYEFDPTDNFVLNDYIDAAGNPPRLSMTQKDKDALSPAELAEELEKLLKKKQESGLFFAGYNITKTDGTLVGKFVTPGLSYIKKVIDTVPEAQQGASFYCNAGKTRSCLLYLTTPGTYHINVLLLRRVGGSTNVIRNPKTVSVTLPHKGSTYQTPGPGPAVMKTYLLQVNP
jgi:hypothetical protein